MRINVTGNAGAGKSTLARRISLELGLTLIEMDRIVWAPGWKSVPKERRKRLLLPQLEEPSWVLDGVSLYGRERADLVIFLDFPPSFCAWRCIKRGYKYSFLTRPELPEDCPDWRILPKLFQIIYSFPSSARPVILQDIKKRGSNDIIITNQYQLDSFEPNKLKSHTKG